jgi:hypothetical protein
MLLSVLLAALFSAAAAAPARLAAQAAPAPAAHLGYPVGADRQLADWGEVLGYMEALAAASPRVRLDTVGRTTLGRPFVMLTISSTANLARLDAFREIQARLADPRRLGGPAEVERLVAEGRVVVLITSAIHSTEVGAGQVPMSIAHRLATSEAPREREIREQAIVLLVPSLNPDGSDMVVEWYRSTLGQAWEGASPPFLYHHYTGHDNNRDWYAFTQAETRLTVAHAHNAWRPQIVHDIHQQGRLGSRYFVPPYIDPVEPNVDPILVQGVNQLGTYIAWQMGQEGKTGIGVNTTYDAWTPARAYQHYHAGVRILSETASANMASPVVIPFDSLRPGRGFDARAPSWNFPAPWPGGEWRLADIVDYMEAGAFALLTHAARNREQWLRSFLTVGQRAVTGWANWPEAWVLPVPAGDRAPLDELLRILTTADVEVQRTGQAFTAGGERFAAGSYVVVMRQPYAAFAQAMLERQVYPDLRLYPGGPPQRPYDVTAHTLPLLLGVRAVPVPRVEGGVAALQLSAPVERPAVVRRAAGLTAGPGGATPPRIAIYRSHAPSMDEGWTRWVLDAYGIPFRSLEDAEVRAGGLRQRYDVVVLPSQQPRQLFQGRAAGTVPPRFAGGLGEPGVAALRAFVEAGGTLVALEQASRFAIESFRLPVQDVLTGPVRRDFYIPGSILALELDARHPLAAGMPARSIAWFGDGGMAFEATGTGVEFPARYGAGDPLLSGWALGAHAVAGRGALAEVPLGAGRVILFGFRPQYRGQSMATFPLLFNAMRPRPAAAAARGR